MRRGFLGRQVGDGDNNGKDPGDMKNKDGAFDGRKVFAKESIEDESDDEDRV